MVTITTDFNPEKYKALNSSLATIYSKTGNAALLLERYLSVVTRGSCISDDNGKFIERDFNQKIELSYKHHKASKFG